MKPTVEWLLDWGLTRQVAKAWQASRKFLGAASKKLEAHRGMAAGLGP